MSTGPVPLQNKDFRRLKNHQRDLRSPFAPWQPIAAAPVVDAAQDMHAVHSRLLRQRSDGCGFCHGLARCASAQNERADGNSSSSLRTSCPWPRSSSRRTTCAGSNKALLAFSRRASLAPALTLHRTCANEGLLTAQCPTDGASAPPLLLCAADDFRFLAASVVAKFRRATPVFFARAEPAATHPTEGTHS